MYIYRKKGDLRRRRSLIYSGGSACERTSWPHAHPVCIHMHFHTYVTRERGSSCLETNNPLCTRPLVYSPEYLFLTDCLLCCCSFITILQRTDRQVRVPYVNMHWHWLALAFRLTTTATARWFRCVTYRSGNFLLIY